MAVQIGAKPDSGFDDPLGMLRDCHRRIEMFLAVLCRVAERRESGALNEEERAAVQAALHYFREGGQRHNADEEESLFPRLKNSTATAVDAIGGLKDDHRDASDLHATVDRLFSAWISSGSVSPEDRQGLFPATRQLKALYAEHIRIEEEIVFPYAAQVLDRERIQEIGSEFRARRLPSSR